MKKNEWRNYFPDVSDTQIEQLNAFAELLRDWNQRINLVSRRDVENVWANHMIPSILPLAIIDLPDQCQVLDIGSGSGFPAIPLKILRPHWQLLMVESIRKKNAFLQTAIDTLNLPTAAALNMRAEDAAIRPEFQRKFDLVTVRAVAAIPKLIEWGKPFLKGGGRWLLWKGTSDIPDLKTAAAKMKMFYKIHHVPEAMQSLSPKLEAQCWFEIWKKK